MDFYKAAFDAKELYRVDDGGVAQLSVSGAEFLGRRRIAGTSQLPSRIAGRMLGAYAAHCQRSRGGVHTSHSGGRD